MAEPLISDRGAMDGDAVVARVQDDAMSTWPRSVVPEADGSASVGADPGHAVIVLDTHVLVWLDAGDASLGAGARDLIGSPGSTPGWASF